MIIETFELRNIGPFHGVVLVGPLSEGLNILPANNEAGKSTIVKAAARALFDRHTCRSEEIKALQPIGTGLAPSVAIVFRQQGQAYRIEKTFLESPRSLLSRLTKGSWQLIEEGDRADERLQQLLGSNQPGRGATKPEHWGLFQYLWARQGEPVVWPQWGGEAGKQVRSHLAKIELDPLVEKLKNVLWEKYTGIFTDQGRPKTRGPLASAEEELAALQAELAQIQGRLKELGAWQAQFQTLDEQIGRLALEANEKKQQADEIARKAQEVELLLNELKAHESAFNAAKDKLHAVVGDDEDLKNTQKIIAEVRDEIGRSEERVQKLKSEEADLLREEGTASQALQDEQKTRSQLQARLERTEAILKFRRAQKELDALQSQAREAESKEAEVNQFEEAKSKIPALTPQRLGKLQEYDRELGELGAQIKTIGITAELTPENAAVVEVNELGSKRKFEIKSADTERISAGQTLTMRLHGWGRVRIRSGATELNDLEQLFNDRQRDLAAAFLELGVRTIAQAASLVEQRKQLESKIRDAQRDLRRALANYRDVASLKLAVNQLAAQLASLRNSLHLKSAEEGLALSELESGEESLKSELKMADSRVRHADRRLREIAGGLSQCREDRHNAETDLATLEERQRGTSEHIKGLSGKYPGGMNCALQKAQDDFREAKALLEAAQRKLPPDADRLAERNRRAAAAATQVQRELYDRTEERNKLHGALEARGSEGLYSRETELLEKIEVKVGEAGAARRRGWAARLLHDLVERRKQAATRAVLGPLQDKLSSAFAELTGVMSRRVFLNEGLEIRGVGIDDQDLLPFDLLSQGAREQLLLALRVAVATALSDQEPQSLILDDVLVNTDPLRQERVLDLLQSATRNLQILVLTCHSDRYRGIGNTVSIRLCVDEMAPETAPGT